MHKSILELKHEKHTDFSGKTLRNTTFSQLWRKPRTPLSVCAAPSHRAGKICWIPEQSLDGSAAPAEVQEGITAELRVCSSEDQGNLTFTPSKSVLEPRGRSPRTEPRQLPTEGTNRAEILNPRSTLGTKDSSEPLTLQAGVKSEAPCAAPALTAKSPSTERRERPREQLGARTAPGARDGWAGGASNSPKPPAAAALEAPGPIPPGRARSRGRLPPAPGVPTGG